MERDYSDFFDTYIGAFMREQPAMETALRNWNFDKNMGARINAYANENTANHLLINLYVMKYEKNPNQGTISNVRRNAALKIEKFLTDLCHKDHKSYEGVKQGIMEFMADNKKAKIYFSSLFETLDTIDRIMHPSQGQLPAP